MTQLCRLLAGAFVAGALVGCDSKSAPKVDAATTPIDIQENTGGAAPPPPPPPPLPPK